MKTMRLDKNKSDLEYLAEIGFEKVSVSGQDISDLEARIRKYSFPAYSNYLFVFVCLVMGAFFGVTVFFIFYKAPVSYKLKVVGVKKELSQPKYEAMEQLDTIFVMNENFVKARTSGKKTRQMEKIMESDTLPHTVPHLETKPITEIGSGIPLENKLKYVPNASVKYIRDLKVTDYYTLYFRQNKLVPLRNPSGLTAQYANPDEWKREVNLLEPEPAYYLYEALEDALVLFKKKKYAACIYALGEIEKLTGDDVNVKFYTGMCNFYSGNYNAAIKYFDLCIAHPNNVFLPESEFYKATSLHESGNSDAEELFKKIAEEDGFYAAKARKYLQSAKPSTSL